MTIILFSDVHANLPALEALFENLKREKYDMIYCLGDLVGYNSYPNEVIEEIRLRNITCICGNHDLAIANMETNISEDFSTWNPDRNNNISKNYTNSVLTPASRMYLQSLPFYISFSYRKLDRVINLYLVHGSLNSVDELLIETLEPNYIYDMMEAYSADIMCFGHTHKPYFRLLKNETNHPVKYAINVGSVGKPKDNDHRGCYVILRLFEDEDEVEFVQVKFVRFDYDMKPALDGIARMGLPPEFGDMLQKGY